MKDQDFLDKVEQIFDDDGWTKVKRRFGKVTVRKGDSVITIKTSARILIEDSFRIFMLGAMSALAFLVLLRL